MILKAHILSGCDVTNNTGTKRATIKIHHKVYFEYFAEDEPIDFSFQQTEKYLVLLFQPKSACDRFDQSVLHMFLIKRKPISELPPPSHTIQGHLLRCFYEVNLCINLLSSNWIRLDDWRKWPAPRENAVTNTAGTNRCVWTCEKMQRKIQVL